MKIGEFFDRLAGAKTPKARVNSEAKQAPARSEPAAKRVSMPTMPLTKAALAAAVIVVAFFAGVGFQKSHDDSATSQLSMGSSGSQGQNQNQNSMGNGFGDSSGGGFGGDSDGGGFGRFRGSNFSSSTVTAISTSSITVKDSAGNSDTYSISSDTLISDSGQQVSASDIQTGDTVIVIPDRDDTSTARRIIVNPDFGQNQNEQTTPVDPGETELN